MWREGNLVTSINQFLFQKCNTQIVMYYTAQQLTGALEPELSWGWPASKFSISFFLCTCLAFTFFAISNCLSTLVSLSFTCSQLFSGDIFSYDVQVRKWFMLSSFLSNATQRWSWYFQGCHSFMSNVFDLRLKIILLNEVFLLSSKYSLVLSSSKIISFVFARTEFSKTNCLNA